VSTGGVPATPIRSAKGTPRSSSRRASRACPDPAPGKTTAIDSEPWDRRRTTSSATSSISSDRDRRHDGPGEVGRALPSRPELGHRGAGLFGVRDVRTAASTPRAFSQRSTHSSPRGAPSAELGLGQEDAGLGAAPRERQEPQELRPALGAARKDEQPVGEPRTIPRAGKGLPVDEGTEGKPVPAEPLDEAPEELAELGQPETLRAEPGAKKVLKLGDRRFKVAREALPQAPGGVLGGKHGKALPDEGPEDEDLQASAKA
jgi:hypothetical protein